MFGLFPLARRRATTRRLPRPALCLEHLETRDCPAAPTLTFNAAVVYDRMVEVSGTVVDENPQTVVVRLSGVAAGEVRPNVLGHYSLLVEAGQLGTLSAVASDEEGLSSAEQKAELVSAPPQIEWSLTPNQDGSVTITGRVLDEEPAGRVVTLSGVVNAVVVTGEQGEFNLTADPTGPGEVTARTTDAWDQAAEAAAHLYTPTTARPITWLESNLPPRIVGFEGSQGPGGTWTFEGTVEDESPGGLVIEFGGLPGMEGKTAVVNDDGTFSITVELEDEDGSVTAVTRDWYGDESNTAIFMLP